MLESRGTRKRTRAWRRCQRRRMIAKAWRIAKEWNPSPKGISALRTYGAWMGIGGQWRRGPVTWEDVFAIRDDFAHRNCDCLARCSCWMCGNPRKFLGERTLQERRADDAFQAELADFLSIRP